jgi:Fe-S oxidoreductase
MIFAKDQGFRALPAIAETPSATASSPSSPGCEPKLKVALFSGCVQDFVYPEQAEAAVKLLAKHDVEVVFPMDQSCCGLPVQMMGEASQPSGGRAEQTAFDPADCDYILTLCASCASHLKHGYPDILADDPALGVKARQFADRVIDFSSFAHDVLHVSPDEFRGDGKKTTYHSPCHLCRGMHVTEAPRALMGIAGLDYAPSEEEDVCCGFGGTYSMKFPELSAELLKKKLANVEKTGQNCCLRIVRAASCSCAAA